MRHSKLQLEILSLYKKFLRRAANSNPSVREQIRESFREGARSYSVTDFFLIEHELHKARRQLKQLESASITGYTKVSIKRDNNQSIAQQDKCKLRKGI